MQLLIPEKEPKRLGGIDFFVFPLIIPPLSYEEAKECLGSLIESTAEAIKSLHILAVHL